MQKLLIILCIFHCALAQETAETCFSKIKGPQRKVKYDICQRNGSYPFEITDITLGNVLFNKVVERTSLFTGYTVQLCLFGKMGEGKSIPSKMQHSVHGKISVLPNAPEIPIDFCAINTDGCAQTSPKCDTVPSNGNVCVCTDVKVPDLPIDYDKVETVWKLLDVSNSTPETNVGDCEKEFNEDKLKSEKNKETLACVTIPTQVKQNPPEQFLEAFKEVSG